MPQDDGHRLDCLFLEAASLDEDERSVFLDRLAAEDEEVAGDIRRRLRAMDDLPDTFLEVPDTHFFESALRNRPDPEPQAPADTERYEIGECLGTGGMAHVYRAFDHQLGRPVALKILLADDAATPRRLLREARAQARIRHDHVLDVYETGEIDRRPYIAVRYVSGGTLADLDPSVPLEQKVRLAAQVAEGLHAAHREGLLHGDVKPSNILVEETPDGDLRAWVGDFGIATEMADRKASHAGLAGTPQFMAPELLGEDRTAADRRADVFSLGVTLHQLLLGELPSQAGSSAAALHARDVPPDLAAILTRCLAREPAERYPSARAVAEDLRRFLDGEVVQAYADHWTYRLSRFAVRHRALLTVAGIAALLLAGALLVAAFQGVRAVRANEVAEQRRTQAEDLIDFMLLDLRDKLEPVGRLDLLDSVGDRALEYFAAVPERELSDAELGHRSTALYQIGDVRMRRGNLEDAQRAFDESLILARELAARDPDDAQRLYDLGQSEFWVGYAHWRRGNLASARRHFETYHEISRRLVAREPDRFDWLRELSYAHSNLGSVLQEEGDLEGALERFRAALELDRQLVSMAPTPQQADAQRFELAASHNTVGLILQKLGRLDEAQEHYEADLALRRELSAKEPANRRWQEFLGMSHHYLGALLLDREELGVALPHFEAACTLFDDLAAYDPDNGDWLYKQALCRLGYGRLQEARGNAATAQRAWREAYEIARSLTQRDPKRSDWRELLVDAREALGRHEKDT